MECPSGIWLVVCWEKGDSNYERVNVTTIATIVFSICIYVLDKNTADSLLYFCYKILIFFLAQEISRITLFA